MADDRALCDPDFQKGSEVCYVCLTKKKVKDLAMGLGEEVDGEQIPRAMFNGSQGHVDIPRCKECVNTTILILETFSGFQMICYGKKPEKKFAKLRQDLAKAEKQVGKMRDLLNKNKGSAAQNWGLTHELEAIETLLAAAKNDEAAAQEALKSSRARMTMVNLKKLKKSQGPTKGEP